ncbi:2',5'-phosphodiesterase 12 [Araneus ventricosus]|uniref:2',5'-phosphodiesterase 12 n=1 Tax=Araneus ventricosus TaxID=182803 RepID=A0A4Y2B7V3_ARAVE|nr:2',5'-phosphodiesterase 12 [Araneus ventricosus]
MKPVLDAVVKLVNTIQSRGLNHRQFRDFLHSVQSEYSDVLFYTKVRWLSAGCVFERVWLLKDDIVSFFHEKQYSAECEMLEDTEWLSDFAFFTDLLCHMNNLNVKMQGKNQFIDDIWAHLKAFKLKLNLFAGQLAKNDLSHFSRLNSIPSNLQSSGIIFCGDFNSLPHSPTYNFLMSGKYECSANWNRSSDASGDTVLEHSLSLDSACGTPEYTNYTAEFTGCLDYIFYSKDILEVSDVVPMPRHEQVTAQQALPSEYFPSDHIALICTLQWKKS